jgi:predicted RNase H-like nuclease (RuvC/YqgF family)
MLKCNHCGDELLEEEIVCNGCQENYHFSCSISETTYRAKSKEGRAAWRCQSCRDKKKKATTSSSAVGKGALTRSQSGSTTPVEYELEKEISELEGELNPSLKVLLVKVLRSVQFMSDKFDEMKKTVEESVKENKELKKEIQSLREVIEKKDTVIDGLTSKINKLQQYKKRKFMEIHGVDSDPGISPSAQYEQIAKTIGVDNTDVKDVQRIQLKKSTMLLVKYREETQRNECLDKGKKWWRDLSSDEKKKSNRLYFNESLIPEFRNLLREVRIKGRLENVKYIWVKNGRILVRKEDQGRVYSISTESEMRKVF